MHSKSISLVKVTIQALAIVQVVNYTNSVNCHTELPVLKLSMSSLTSIENTLNLDLESLITY